MASINPSPFASSVDDIFVHFRNHCQHTRAALLKRDDLWSSQVNLLEIDDRRNMEALEALRAERDRAVRDLERFWVDRIGVERKLEEEVLVHVERIRVLERNNSIEIERALAAEERNSCERVDRSVRFWKANLNRAVEKERAEMNRKVCVLEGQLMNKEKRILQLVKAVERSNWEKKAEIQRIMNEITALEEEKEIVVHMVELLETNNQSMEVELEKTKTKSENSAEVERLMNKIMALEEGNKIGADRVEVLERSKAAMEGELLKTLSEKSAEVERLMSKIVAVEEGKKIVVDKSAEVERLMSKIVAVEEGKKIVVDRVEILERDMEAELERTKSEKSTEVERIMKEKRKGEEYLIAEITKLSGRLNFLEMLKSSLDAEVANKKTGMKTLEAEKKKLETEKNDKIIELMKRICIMEKEKVKSEAEVSSLEELERKISEAKQMILIAKTALEAETDNLKKKNLALGDEIHILEGEKKRLQAEIKEKDEVINVLYKENCLLDNVKMELKMEIEALASKLKEDAYLTKNVAPWEDEGRSSAGVACSNEHHGSLNDSIEMSDEMTRTNASKRKRPIRECKEEPSQKILKSAACDHPPISTGSNGGDVVVACRWEVDQDLLDALDADEELCLKSVCALFRQHTQLSDSENASIRVKALGEYLTTEDPECTRMKKMVRKLNKLDVNAVGVCREIAKQHYKEVFEIYKRRGDPVFLS